MHTHTKGREQQTNTKTQIADVAFWWFKDFSQISLETWSPGRNCWIGSSSTDADPSSPVLHEPAGNELSAKNAQIII